jgi:hypothetical protein
MVAAFAAALVSAGAASPARADLLVNNPDTNSVLRFDGVRLPRSTT